MNIPDFSQFGKKVTILKPGEYHVSVEDDIICTLLGSCVSVCLHDPIARISGMNHFMVPGKISGNDIFKDRSARYGITAINELINSMAAAGALLENLTAKVFGGGHVLLTPFDRSTVASDNIRLARIMLEIEDIPINEMDVGGEFIRTIILDVQSGKVFHKSIKNNLSDADIVTEKINKFPPSQAVPLRPPGLI